MELVYKKRSKILSPNRRPFSSNPTQLKMQKPTLNKNRIKSGFPKMNEEIIPNNLKIQKHDNLDTKGEFHNNMNFRNTRPKSRYQDKIFNRYWESNATESKTIFKNQKTKLNIITGEEEMINIQENKNKESIVTQKIMKGERNLYKFPHINWDNKVPSKFLNHVGGCNFNFSTTTTTNESSRPNSGLNTLNNLNTESLNTLNNNFIPPKINQRPITAMNNQISNNTKNKFLRPQTAFYNKNKISRPQTAMKSELKKINEKKNEIPDIVKTKFENSIKEQYKYKESFFNEEDIKEEKNENSEHNNINNINDINIYPHVESLLNKFNQIDLKHYSIKTSQADKDLLDIFDRAQKTHASTLGKVGNYEYFSTYQRIGSFMDFSQHLKLDALLKIGKDIYQNRKNLLEYQSKHNIQKPVFGELLVNTCLHFRDSNSLFHGFMPFEEEGQELIKEYGHDCEVYDPLDFLPKFEKNGVYNLKNFTEELLKNITTSINNYKKYLVSEKFRDTDLKHFNRIAFRKKLIKTLDLNIKLNNDYRMIINININEIEKLFYDTLKKAIMNYILRSPFERKRLNILFYPRKILPASVTIAQYGSFNRTKYSQWVNNYNNSFNYLNNNLSLCNIAVSGLIGWTRCFTHVNIIYLDLIDNLKEKGKNSINTIHIDEFCRIQESYLTKVFHFMRDIYYRGAILITKKNKALKRKDVFSEGKWTFKGFIPHIEENENEYKDKLYGMNYEDQLRDFWVNINLDNLIDIRITASNIGYVTYILKKRIDLSVSDYDEMNTESKIKINNSVTTYCTIFFRKLIEKALKDFNNFFDKYVLNSEIYEKLEKKESSVRDLIYETDEDIRLPDLITFYTSQYVDPLISIKTKYDVLYNLIKIEYNFEQVYEKISKIIDSICGIFNQLCTSHFLEFKKILPSQREKVVKEHSTKLNEFFNADPNKNKSFLEEYYKTFCPNLILEEIDSENYIKSYLNVMSTNELFVGDIKSKIYRKIKLQYSEIEECLQLFDPLKELITNNLDDSIKIFVEKRPTTPDYGSFIKFLRKIRKMKKYLDIIPKKLEYSMFAIDNREVIDDLRKKLNNDLVLLYHSLEIRIVEIYERNNEKFNQFVKELDVKLTTPEELVEMDKTKVRINAEFTETIRDYEDSDKILLFLIKEDDIFPTEFKMKICDGIKKFYKFKAEQERIDKIHQDNRETLENIFRKERNELEAKMNEYISDINSLDKQTRQNDYEDVVVIINEIQDKLEKLNTRIEKSIKDEELLFDYKNEGFDDYNNAKKKLDKLSVLWKKTQEFYEERKVLIHHFSELIDLERYINTFDDIENEIKTNKEGLSKGEEIIAKVSKKVEDDIDNITNFLTIMQQVIDSPIPLKDDLKKDALEASENKNIEQNCREILFSYYSKKV